MNGIGTERGLPELMTHAAWLRRLAVSLVRDPDAADDVVQATLVTAWSQPPATDRDVRPWLAEVARNQAHDQRRGEGRRRAREDVAASTPDFAAPTAPVSPEQLIGDLEIHRTVAEVVTALAPAYRDVLVAHFYEGISAADIARRLDVPAGTIRWRLKEGLDRVKAELDRRHDGDRTRWQPALLPLVPAEFLRRPDGAGKPSMIAPARPAGPSLAPRAGSALRTGLGVGAWLAAATAVIAVVAYLFWPTRPQPDRAAPGATAAAIGSGGASRHRLGASAPTVPRFALPAAEESDPEAGRAQREADSILKRMLAAMADDDYDAFLERGHDFFKAAFTRAAYRELSSLAKRLRGGYEAQPLGSLRKTVQKVHPVIYLWKLELNDGGPELLLTLAMLDGTVAGFFVK